MDKAKWWLSAAAALTVIGGLFFMVKEETANTSQNEEVIVQDNSAFALLNQQLPSFTMTDPESQKDSVSIDDYFDKPILLIEWASWCPYCQRQLPVIQEVYEELGSEVNFVALNLTDGVEETPQKAQTYIEEQGFTFPYYLDINETVADQLQVETIPTIYIVDKTKKIKKIFVDHQTKDQLIKELKTVLEE